MTRAKPEDRDPPGTVYPPGDGADIAAYDDDEAYAGFREHQAGEPIPGPNRSPAYRWGATNAARTRQLGDDGFDGVRRDYLAMRRRLH